MLSVSLLSPRLWVEYELRTRTGVTHDAQVCVNPLGDLFSQLMREDPSTIKGAENLMLGEMLTLPQNFG